MFDRLSRSLSAGNATATRARLRDAMSRLRAIRRTCGKEDADDAGQSSGDPFSDKIMHFTVQCKQLRETIQERNENQRRHMGGDADMARDSHEINMIFRDLGTELREVSAFVDSADRDLARANSKQKTPEKIALCERMLKERRTAYENCREALESLRELNQQRFMSETEAKDTNEAAATRHQTSHRLQLREQLASRLRRRRRGGGGGDDDEELDDITGQGRPSRGGRLEDSEETKDQMKALAAKQAKQDAALDRVQACLGRITEAGMAIGAEFDKQNEMIDEAEDKMSKATSDLRRMNRALTKFAKEKTPLTIIMTVAAFILGLSLVGYFLSEFDVI